MSSVSINQQHRSKFPQASGVILANRIGNLAPAHSLTYQNRRFAIEGITGDRQDGYQIFVQELQQAVTTCGPDCSETSELECE